MAKDNQELSLKLQEQGAPPTKLSLQGALDAWKKEHFPKLAALAKNQEHAEKLYVVCLNTMSRNLGLLECTFPSLTACLLQSFQLNLFPGPFQECAYVPLRNKHNDGKKEANFWPMYQGLMKLMLNAGNKSVIARVVYKGDHFEFKEGKSPPVYKPAATIGAKREDRLFVYAAVCDRSGYWRVEVMDPEQIAAVKARSRAASQSDSPWNSKYEDDVNAMWAKTAIKRISKFVSKSPELVTAIDLDNQVDGDVFLEKPQLIALPSVPLQEADENNPEKDASA